MLSFKTMYRNASQELLPHCCCVAWAQDARAVLAEARELKFALEESHAAAEHLQSELATAQVRVHARHHNAGCPPLLPLVAS